MMDAERSKRATVWIAWDDGRYFGYWDLEPGGPPTQLGQMPDSESATRGSGLARHERKG